MWIVPAENLTPDQATAVNLSFDKHRIVVGAPGAGKTLVLAHRAKKMLGQLGSAERIKLLVFTNVLVKFIREGMEQIGFSENEVQTFDSWCIGEYRKLIGENLPRKGQKGYDFDAIRQEVLSVVRKGVSQKYDAIFVDEGQDLTETAVELLARYSKHVTIALDSKQKMYAAGVGINEAANALGILPQASTLVASYRCTPLIRDIASEFLEDDDEARSFRSLQLYGIDGVEKPAFVESDNDADEWDAFVKLINQRALQNQTCAILMPDNKSVFRAKREFEKRNLIVSTREDADFNDLQPELLTYHSAKGLTVDTVFLPKLTEASFANIEGISKKETLLFVGVTRAAKWVCLGTRTQGTVEKLAKALPALVQRGSIVKINPLDTNGVDSVIDTGSSEPGPWL